MKDGINIIYSRKFRDIAGSLASKLQSQDIKVRQWLLKGNPPYSVTHFKQVEALLDVLFIHPEEVLIIDDNSCESQTKESFVYDRNDRVLYYFEKDDFPNKLHEYWNIRKANNNIEWLRHEIVILVNQLKQIGNRYSVFVGRRNEIEQFQKLLYSDRAFRTKAIFVSGRIGVGREAFVRECIRMSLERADYEPFFLSMGSNGNVEMLLVQLNSILGMYEEAVFREMLNQTPQEKTSIAVQLLNEFIKENNYIVIYDECACLRYDRKLSDWFHAIVTHQDLRGQMHIYVISTVAINYYRARDEEGVAFFTLYSMTLSERKMLLYKLLSNANLCLNEDDVQFIADSLQYSPNQIVQIVEDIKTQGGKFAINNIEKYQAIGDNRARPLIKKYESENYFEARNVLVLLSKWEFVSEKILKAVFQDTFEEVLREIDQFTADGIVECFGKGNDYFRLDSYMRDYFLRNKLDYNDSSLDNHIRECLSKMIAKESMITDDYSTYMYAVKQEIEENSITDDTFLISSIIVNSIIESYHKRKWEQVVTLCEMVFERKPNYFSDVFRVIRYWYCLALARLHREDVFFDNLVEFSGTSDHGFLLGFFYRNMKKYGKAEDEYRKSLELNPNHQRAKRELVLCLIAQRKFSSALSMAYENHNRNPENTYLLHSYFRCWVRKHDLTIGERKELLELLKECEENRIFSPSYLDGMKFEYERFAEMPRQSKEYLLTEALRLEKKNPNSLYIKELVSELRYECGIESYIIPMEYDDELEA